MVRIILLILTMPFVGVFQILFHLLVYVSAFVLLLFMINKYGLVGLKETTFRRNVDKELRILKSKMHEWAKRK